MEVFKVQRPLAANVGMDQAPWLAYNESRSVQLFLKKEDVPEILRLETAATGKVYAQAEMIMDVGDEPGTMTPKLKFAEPVKSHPLPGW
jgi:hypothetical protein